MINFYKNKQNILYVCPALKWGTRERMVLRDCLLGKEIGHNVFLYCLKDSPLARRAKEKRIDCIYHIGRSPNKVTRWSKLKHLVNYVERLDINLVHCYDFRYLVPMTYFLRKIPKVPLIFTFHQQFKKFYRQPWYKVLLSRIDLVLLPGKEMIDDIHHFLGIPARKLEFYGLGIKKSERVSPVVSKDFWNIGIYITGNEDFSELMSSISFLKDQNIKDKSCKVHFIYDEATWVDKESTSSLEQDFDLRGLSELVSFQHFSDIPTFQKCMDLWIGLTSEGPVQDFVISALIAKVPVITSRKESTRELLRKFPGVGETYKEHDSRERRQKIELVLRNLDEYKTTLKDCAERVYDQNGVEFHKNQLVKSYERVLNRRLNYYERKKSN